MVVPIFFVGGFQLVDCRNKCFWYILAPVPAEFAAYWIIAQHVLIVNPVAEKGY